VPDWKVQIKNYFVFSKTESRGIFILLSILFLLIIINFLLPWLITSDNIDFSEFEKEIEQLKEGKSSNVVAIDKESAKLDENINYPERLKPFMFDPNGLPSEDWKKLGLEDWQIKVIKNYEAKGGVFRDKDDLAGIYSISEEEFRILEPFISIKGNWNEPGEKIDTPLEIKPSEFDPNTLGREKWLEMGLKENVVTAILNYREKGGKFNVKQDLKKIYTLSEKEYLALEPFIMIAEVAPPDVKVIEKIIVGLNDADTLDLQQLTGIGPSFAKRIVKYRDLLGGFYAKEQLMEVYGMDSIKYVAIKDYVTVDPSLVRKMNINTISIKEMIKHPYFEFYIAKSILNYRNEIGKYIDIAQIKEAKLIYDQLFTKIEPYLTIK
jgi:DNA uptake protein ComE-like DNA-binding protein